MVAVKSFVENNLSLLVAEESSEGVIVSNPARGLLHRRANRIRGNVTKFIYLGVVVNLQVAVDNNPYARFLSNRFFTANHRRL